MHRTGHDLHVYQSFLENPECNVVHQIPLYEDFCNVFYSTLSFVHCIRVYVLFFYFLFFIILRGKLCLSVYRFFHSFQPLFGVWEKHFCFSSSGVQIFVTHCTFCTSECRQENCAVDLPRRPELWHVLSTNMWNEKAKSPQKERYLKHRFCRVDAMVSKLSSRLRREYFIFPDRLSRVYPNNCHNFLIITPCTHCGYVKLKCEFSKIK